MILDSFTVHHAFKSCACGKSYTSETWKALELKGYQESEDDNGNPIDIELRNCVCGSTLGIVANRRITK